MKPHQPHKYSHESDTQIFKRYPVLRAILDQCFDKLGHIVAVGISAALITVVGSCNHSNTAKLEKFSEEHFHDKQVQIDDLKAGKENK